MRKLTTTEFINKAKLKHGDRYDYSKVIYTGSSDKIKIVCSKHGEFLQEPTNHLNSNGCQICGKDSQINIRSSNTADFVKIAKIKHNCLYDYSLVDYINNRIKVNIICKKHGGFFQTPHEHLDGDGCPKCRVDNFIKRNKKSSEYFHNKCKIVHNNKYDYSDTVFGKTSDKIKVVCREHGEFNPTLNHHLRGSGCPSCKISKGELEIEKWLNKNDIKHESQKRFVDCRNPKTNYTLPFDFFIPIKNVIVEYDGEQHFNNKCKCLWKEHDLKELQYRDGIKTKYCIKHNIKLIRIPYTKIMNIDEILTGELL